MDEEMAAVGMVMLASVKHQDVKKKTLHSTGMQTGDKKQRLRPARNLLRLVVDVPARHFGLDIPDYYYRGRVVRKKTTRQRSNLVVKFDDDSSEYWFPVKNVRQWLDNPRYTNGEGTVGKGADEYAAGVLRDMRAMKVRRGRLLFAYLRGKIRKER